MDLAVTQFLLTLNPFLNSCFSIGIYFVHLKRELSLNVLIYSPPVLRGPEGDNLPLPPCWECQSACYKLRLVGKVIYFAIYQL